MSEHDTYVLDDAIETVYERPNQHGDPEDSFERIGRLWEAYTDHEFDDAEVAMMLGLVKVARSAEGVYDEDNPRDLAGYMECYARLRVDEDSTSTSSFLSSDYEPKYEVRDEFSNTSAEEAWERLQELNEDTEWDIERMLPEVYDEDVVTTSDEVDPFDGLLSFPPPNMGSQIPDELNGVEIAPVTSSSGYVSVDGERTKVGYDEAAQRVRDDEWRVTQDGELETVDEHSYMGEFFDDDVEITMGEDTKTLRVESCSAEVGCGEMPDSYVSETARRQIDSGETNE